MLTRVAIGSLGVLAVAGFVLFTALTLPGREEDPLLDTYLYSGVAILATLVAWSRPVLLSFERLLFTVNATALTVYTAGDLLYVTVISELDPEPYPSASDALWLAYYVFATTVLLMLLRERLKRVPMSVRLDAAVVGLGVATFTAALSFDTIADAAEGSFLEVAVTLAYPVADLVLLGLAGATVAAFAGRIGLRWWLMVAGAVAFAVADTTYAYRSATGGYTEGTAVDVLWLLALLLQAGAAWAPAHEWRRPTTDNSAVLAVPVLMTAAALALMVGQRWNPVSLVALGLAAATVVTAVARIALRVGETREVTQVRMEARTDDLTGLANRRALQAEADNALQAHGEHMALVRLELDGLEDINDTYGHAAGDAMLSEVAARWLGVVRHGETLARLGGDEFAVLLPGDGRDRGRAVALAMAAELADPVVVGDVEVQVGVNAGLVVAPRDGVSLRQLLDHADTALWRARRSNLTLVEFEDSSNERRASRRDG